MLGVSMERKILIQLTISIFAVFALLLIIGKSISNEEGIYDLESRVDNLESQISEIEWKLER